MSSETALLDRWRSLLTCYNEVAVNLERALAEAHALSLSEFETLDRLATQNCDKRRMQELAEAMYLSQSALSRTVTRLVDAGLVERTSCVQDRRGIFVELTEAGRARHAEARHTHLAVLAEHLPAPT
ncbi:MarR family winged helix-turn-helix transcriptional regulator [Actinoplanes utahensis]|uniref:MarR family transcriptional regulator n=1 Tax=Actinoplanes utahensis TaxID=1869 RepID=A0A0A6X253_ACTUT|nr:MarR family transcriptional regulator [Actinoplanes utahensis]KHD74177.1 MarR family transcriptional regulator [Actinoplanes utahensis]GIF33657.1 MarR family transcriptional regulator [Actinoplanes utahensis]